MSHYRILTYSGSDPALRAYLSMIYSDFMRSLRYGNSWFKLIDSGSFFETYGDVIDSLLARSESIIKLAVLSEDLDVCLGWSLIEGTKFHYIFVKKPYRNNGIGTSLLPATFDQITHLTEIGQAIRKAKFRNIIFDPFLI